MLHINSLKYHMIFRMKENLVELRGFEPLTSAVRL